MARHLNTQQLTSWLNGEDDHEDHFEHLDTCAKCAARIEELDVSDANVNNVTPLKDEFRPALLAVLQPPSDLHERISVRIGDRLQSQSDADLIGSMLGVSMETVQLISDSNSEID